MKKRLFRWLSGLTLGFIEPLKYIKTLVQSKVVDVVILHQSCPGRDSGFNSPWIPGWGGVGVCVCMCVLKIKIKIKNTQTGLNNFKIAIFKTIFPKLWIIEHSFLAKFVWSYFFTKIFLPTTHDFLSTSQTNGMLKCQPDFFKKKIWKSEYKQILFF